MDLRKQEEHNYLKVIDEIPENLRKEFHLPLEMSYFDINYS